VFTKIREKSQQTAQLPFGFWNSYHRLNGSSSPVLTVTSLSYGKAKNSTSDRIKIPHLIEIKFGMVDYLSKTTFQAKFHVNLSKGGFPADG